MKRNLATVLAVLVLVSLALTMLFLLLSRSLGDFLQAAALPMLIVLAAGHTAGRFPGGGRPFTR